MKIQATRPLVRIGLIIGCFVSGCSLLHAAEGAAPSFWEPEFDQGAPVQPNGNKGSYILKVSPHFDEEQILSPAVTLIEAIRVAGFEQGPARVNAFSTLWRRYNTTVLVQELDDRVAHRSLTDAAIAAEIMLAGGEKGESRIKTLLLSKDKRLADRMICALVETGSQATPMLLALLNQETTLGNREVTRRLVWAIGRSGGAGAADALAGFIDASEREFRLLAVDSLGHLPVDQRTTPLAKFAVDSDARVRLRSAEIYAEGSREESRDVISRLAQDSDEAIRSVATVALSTAPWDSREQLRILITDKSTVIRAESSHGLALRADDNERRLLLHSDDAVIRRAAAGALVELEGVSVVLLSELAVEPEKSVRVKALERIVTSREPQAKAAALAFVADQDDRVAEKALTFVGDAWSTLDPKALRPLAGRGSAAIQARAVETLFSMPADQATEVLSHFINTPDPAQRIRIAERLGQQPSPQYLQALGSRTSDSDPAVQVAAIKTLTLLPYPDAGTVLAQFLADSDVEVRVEATRAIGSRRDPASVLGLTQLLDDEAEQVRETAVWALGEIGDDVAAGALARFMHDMSPAVSQNALDALTDINSPTAIAFIGELFDHPDAAMRSSAIRYLRERSRKEPEQSARQLTLFLQDPDYNVQALAIEACGATGHAEVLASLEKMLDQQDATIRLAAVSALRHVRDDRAVASLEKFVSDVDMEVRKEAYRGLARVGGSDGFALLIGGIYDDREPVRVTVIEEIGDLRLGMAVPQLVGRLPEAAIREQKAIIEALGVIRSAEATDKLIELAASDGVWQRLMAQKALDKKVQSEAELMNALSRSSEPRIEVTLDPTVLKR